MPVPLAASPVPVDLVGSLVLAVLPVVLVVTTVQLWRRLTKPFLLSFRSVVQKKEVHTNPLNVF